MPPASIRKLIDAREGEALELRSKIRSGEEYRDVDIEITMHSPERGKKRAVRVDNGQELWVREMTTTELQEQLFPDDREYRAVSGSGTEDDPYIFEVVEEMSEEEIKEAIEELPE